MTKQEFINQKIAELKEAMYKDEDMMTEKEEEIFRKFFDGFIEDLKKIAKISQKRPTRIDSSERFEAGSSRTS